MHSTSPDQEKDFVQNSPEVLLTSSHSPSPSPLRWLIMITLLVVVGVVGYLLGLRQSGENNLNSGAMSADSNKTVEEILMEASPSPTPTLAMSDPVLYKSEHYPYQLIYPGNFSYINRDAGSSQYEGYKEQAYFDKGDSWGIPLDAFYIYISKNKEPIEYIFDGEPTGTYLLDGQESFYREMPEGYGDGGGGGLPRAPMLVVQIQKNEAMYKIVFMGTSSIKDPVVVKILEGWNFTER